MALSEHIIEACAAYRTAEKSLRNAIGEAARDAGAERIAQLTQWLKATQQLLVECTSGDTNLTLLSSAPSAEPLSAARRNQKRSYPLFFQFGAALVKVGWSKKERAEYEHKASRAVIDSLGAALSEAGKKGRIFTMDSLFPLVDTNSGQTIPDYQAYLGLAWLRHTKLIEQHGRRGYTIASKQPLAKAIDEQWSKLEQRST